MGGRGSFGFLETWEGVMSLEQIGELVKDVGFPVAVATFVLVRLNGKMDRLTEALYKLIEKLEQQAHRAALRDAEMAYEERVRQQGGSL